MALIDRRAIGAPSPAGRKSVAFNISFTQELKAFFENSSRFFTKPAESLWTAAENERTKTLQHFRPMLNSG